MGSVPGRQTSVLGSSKTYAVDTLWYTGQQIDEYLTVVKNVSENKVYSFNTDFLHRYESGGLPAIVRWIKKPIFDYEQLLFPVHVNRNHWQIAVCNVPDRTVMCHDSLGDFSTAKASLICAFLQDWREFQTQRLEIDPEDRDVTWNVIIADTPRQTNANDSGPWILYIAKCALLKVPLKFNQSKMQFIRRTQKIEVLRKSIMPCFLVGSNRYKSKKQKNQKKKLKRREKLKQLKLLNKSKKKKKKKKKKLKQTELTEPEPDTTINTPINDVLLNN